MEALCSAETCRYSERKDTRKKYRRLTFSQRDKKKDFRKMILQRE